MQQEQEQRYRNSDGSKHCGLKFAHQDRTLSSTRTDQQRRCRCTCDEATSDGPILGMKLCSPAFHLCSSKQSHLASQTVGRFCKADRFRCLLGTSVGASSERSWMFCRLKFIYSSCLPSQQKCSQHSRYRLRLSKAFRQEEFQVHGTIV